LPASLFGQSFKINLSPKHQLSSIQSGHKQMREYYKFLKKDNARQVKSKNKAAKHEWDSLRHAEASTKKINSTLKKRGITGERQVAYADSLQTELRNCKAILANTSATPAMKGETRKKIKTLTKDKVNNELAKNRRPNKLELRIADSLKSELTKWWTVMKDTAAKDSTRKVARA